MNTLPTEYALKAEDTTGYDVGEEDSPAEPPSPPSPEPTPALTPDTIVREIASMQPLSFAQRWSVVAAIFPEWSSLFQNQTVWMCVGLLVFMYAYYECVAPKRKCGNVPLAPSEAADKVIDALLARK